MSPAAKNQKEIETEKICREEHAPHLVEMDADAEAPSATFRSSKKLLINWVLRGAGVLAVTGAGFAWLHEYRTFPLVLQTVSEMRDVLQDMKYEQKEQNRLLIELLRDARRP